MNAPSKETTQGKRHNPSILRHLENVSLVLSFRRRKLFRKYYLRRRSGLEGRNRSAEPPLGPLGWSQKSLARYWVWKFRLSRAPEKLLESSGVEPGDDTRRGLRAFPFIFERLVRPGRSLLDCSCASSSKRRRRQLERLEILESHPATLCFPSSKHLRTHRDL